MIFMTALIISDKINRNNMEKVFYQLMLNRKNKPPVDPFVPKIKGLPRTRGSSSPIPNESVASPTSSSNNSTPPSPLLTTGGLASR
jgi:hypothetical protein